MSSEPVAHPGTVEELVLRGVGASPGIAIGKVLVLKKDGIVVEEKTVADSAVELERLQKSIERGVT